jgi:hypothetical protein
MHVHVCKAGAATPSNFGLILVWFCFDFNVRDGSLQLKSRSLLEYLPVMVLTFHPALLQSLRRLNPTHAHNPLLQRQH